MFVMRFSEKALGRVDEEKKFFENVVSYIPGYHGYQEREKIRETDKLVREELFRVLRIGVNNLVSCYNTLVSRNNPLYNDVDRVKLKADRIAEKVRHAEYGYAGVFDPIKVQREELLSLVRFDGELIDSVQSISDSAETILRLSRQGEDLKAPLSTIELSLENLDKTFNQRKQFMQGLKG
jgi:hypothetical protein